MSTTSITLLERLRQGDQATGAFSGHLFSVAVSLGHRPGLDSQDADLVQDVFVALFRPSPT